MGVRSARLPDLIALRHLDRVASAAVLAPAPHARRSSVVVLALLSGWPSVGQRAQTLILSQGASPRGFVQATARADRESWDLVRLACLADGEEQWQLGCIELLNRLSAGIAQRGALRTFARVPSDAPELALFAESGFRPFATELPLYGVLRALVERADLPGSDVRARAPHDAWDVFSLYCAATPALVRHAEGRSLKEWTQQRRIARRQRPNEVVVGEAGNIQLWLRCHAARRGHRQRIEILARPDAAHRLPEVLRFAVELGALDPHRPTMCRAREYDGRISATLEEGGFAAGGGETLLVRHTVARATERQLLIAALRAQGLGIDVSRYRQNPDPMHQRLASSREAVYRTDGRYFRTSNHR